MLQKAVFYILKGGLLHIRNIRTIVDNFIISWLTTTYRNYDFILLFTSEARQAHAKAILRALNGRPGAICVNVI